ncbi:MAG: hypothetical protein IPP93_08740 [Chitinophagaceae bacterium]|nr:hypothetical protein [Chitinophagaceae bacterium]
MKTILTPDIQEVMNAVHYRPSVSVILPVIPGSGFKASLAYTLKTLPHKIELELQKKYPDDICQAVIRKLKSAIKNVDYNTRRKSIAIYISPVFEKLLYLDIALDEKIFVDESFEIRDLLYCKKQSYKCLVLLLGSKGGRICLWDNNNFLQINTGNPGDMQEHANDAPERVANFSDMADRKEVLMENTLHQVDRSLSSILHIYQLPLFVLGNDRVLGHFKSRSSHNAAVTEYVHGNYEEASAVQLAKILEPHITAARHFAQQHLLSQLEEAAGQKQLVCGMKAVWDAVQQKRGRLLVVEKNYMYAGPAENLQGAGTPSFLPVKKNSLSADIADEAMERVLKYGGDVEFTEEGVLDAYEHIALVLYY